MSLTAIGIPASGPRSSPARSDSSIFSACSTVGTPDTGELYLLNDFPAADFYTFHVDLFIGFAAIDLITDTSSLTLGETKFLVSQQFASQTAFDAARRNNWPGAAR